MRRIMLINAKGGCGKSTIATSLASYYASQGKKTVLLDHDPQGSSLHWLRHRSNELPKIRGIDGARPKPGATRTWLHHGGAGETQIMIIDTPAGVERSCLYEMVRRADDILVPVMPSSFDIHAVSQFLQELMVVGKVRSQGKRIAMISNRIKNQFRLDPQLEQFLSCLEIPEITRLRDSQNYTQALERGIGIHELQSKGIERDLKQWHPLLEWLDGKQSTTPSVPQYSTEQGRTDPPVDVERVASSSSL
jgi:chromosome partitioning protein